MWKAFLSNVKGERMIEIDREKFIDSCKKRGCVILEVTTKQFYVIEKGTHQSIDELKKEWFEEYENARHAYKDASLVQYSNKVIEIKEI